MSRDKYSQQNTGELFRLDAEGPFFDIEYDEFTDIFTATAIGIATGSQHIKLAIADSSDAVLDSAVFIQAGSFSDIELQLSQNRQPLLCLVWA